MIKFSTRFYYKFIILIFCLGLITCKSGQFGKKDYTAYFGGEITNATNKYVLFYKDNILLDSILLDNNNRFFKKFDSLSPGLYTFVNEPKSQQIFFDKNDSLTLSVDSKNFENTLVFGGRGNLKNNFIVDIKLKNEKDKDFLYNYYHQPHNIFIPILDSIHQSQISFYEKRKKSIDWSNDFDFYAKAFIDLSYYRRLEFYPRTFYQLNGFQINQDLPKNYYNFRNHININDERFVSFHPFTSYLLIMLNNLVYDDCFNETSSSAIAVDCNIEKLKIANNIFTSEKIKNVILNNIAILYLLEDQDTNNNKRFLDNYFVYSTDKTQHNRILKIYYHTQQLKPGNVLPDEMLIDIHGDGTNILSLIKSPTVICFWSSRTPTHIALSSKKRRELRKKFPKYKFIILNIDDTYTNWKKALKVINPEDPEEFFLNTNMNNSRDKWVVMVIERTIIVNADGTIKEPFVNLLDSNFVDYL